MSASTNRTQELFEAIRGGYAYRHHTLDSTRNYHAVDNKRGVMYLCGCAKPVLLQGRASKLASGRNRHHRFADGFRYGWTRAIRNRTSALRRLDSGRGIATRGTYSRADVGWLGCRGLLLRRRV